MYKIVEKRLQCIVANLLLWIKVRFLAKENLEPSSGEVLIKPVDFKKFHSLQFVGIQHRPHLALVMCSVNIFA